MWRPHADPQQDPREKSYNLKKIPGETLGGHVRELVDTIMEKGEDTCWAFLNLLQTDEDIRATYPQLNIGNVQSTSGPSP